MKRIIIAFIVILNFVGCNKSGETIGNHTSRESFITNYVIADEKLIAGYWIEDKPPFNYFRVIFNKCQMIDANNTLYKQYRDHYNDINFNSSTQGMPVVAIADEFTSIDVICNKDFDAEHPAGASLADIIIFTGSSAYPYIESRYIGNEYYHGIIKPLTELSTKDMILLRYDMKFEFTKPRPAGEQTYTITFKTKDKTLQTSITME